MVKTMSRMTKLGEKATSFTLPDFTGKYLNIDDYNKEKPLLVMFICNHCPYVKHIISTLSRIAKEIQALGVDVVAINSNDTENFPEDSPENMLKFSKLHEFSFPYLFDESQDVAKSYQAACTPDFFLYDKKRSLVYRGQMDNSRPENTHICDGKDLIKAVSRLLKGMPNLDPQKPSMGCNIKWKVGNEP